MKTKAHFAYNPKKPSQHLYRDVRTGIFCTRFTINGKAYRLSTGVRDARSAQEIAFKRYCDLFFGLVQPPSVERAKSETKNKSVKLSDIITLFIARIVDFSGQAVSLQSAKGYVNALKRIVGNSFCDSENITLDKLTDDVIRTHRAKRYADKCLDFATDKDLILNHSINSEITNALSVFSIDALKLYKSEGYAIPQNILELKDVQPLPARKPDFIPIPDAIDKEMMLLAGFTLGDCVQVEPNIKTKLPSKQTAVVYELARFCSLTCKEIQNARWSWIDTDRIRIAGNSEFSTKRNAKDRQIPVSPERVARWKKALFRGDENEFIITAQTETARLDATSRTTNQWIKLFFNRQKGLHELRKMATSDFLRATNGDVYKVADIIGDDPRTMLKYYAAVLEMKVKAL